MTRCCCQLPPRGASCGAPTGGPGSEASRRLRTACAPPLRLVTGTQSLAARWGQKQNTTKSSCYSMSSMDRTAGAHEVISPSIDMLLTSEACAAALCLQHLQGCAVETGTQKSHGGRPLTIQTAQADRHFSGCILFTCVFCLVGKLAAEDAESWPWLRLSQ